MAEVSLTLVDPDVYDTAETASDCPEIVIRDGHPAESHATVDDWDEIEHRRQRAEETEDAVTEAQPGTLVEGEAPEGGAEVTATEVANGGVVLKVRRRKFKPHSEANLEEYIWHSSA